MAQSYRRRRSVAALAVALATAACGGPLAKLETGSKDVPLDLLLGAKVRKIGQAPMPPLLVGAPGLARLSKGRTPGFTFDEGAFSPQTFPKAQLPTSACLPVIDPRKRVEESAEPFLVVLPSAAEYTYRTTGFFDFESPLFPSTELAAESKVVVENITPEPAPQDGFVFSTRVTNKEVGTTTTTYRVLRTPVPVVDRSFDQKEQTIFKGNVGGQKEVKAPPVATPQERPYAGTSAIFLAAIQQDDGAVPFRPQYPGIPIARLPFVAGATFEASGSDGTTAVSWHSKVVGTAKVNACGAPVDSWAVELSNGRIVDGDGTDGKGTEVATFTSTMNIAPQYGGLVVHVDTEAHGTVAPHGNVARTVKMTIDQVPK